MQVESTRAKRLSLWRLRLALRPPGASELPRARGGGGGRRRRRRGRVGWGGAGWDGEEAEEAECRKGARRFTRSAFLGAEGRCHSQPAAVLDELVYNSFIRVISYNV